MSPKGEPSSTTMTARCGHRGHTAADSAPCCRTPAFVEIGGRSRQRPHRHSLLGGFPTDDRQSQIGTVWTAGLLARGRGVAHRGGRILPGLGLGSGIRRAPDRQTALRHAVEILAVAVVSSVLLVAPWWGDGRVLTAPFSNLQSRVFHNSLVESIYNVVSGITGVQSGRGGHLLHWGMMSSARLGFVGFVLVLAWRMRSVETLLRGAALATIAWCCVGATWFWPWYAVPAIPFALLTADRRVRVATFVLATPLMAIYVGADICSGVGPAALAAWETWRAFLYLAPCLVYLACTHERMTKPVRP